MCSVIGKVSFHFHYVAAVEFCSIIYDILSLTCALLCISTINLEVIL